MEHWTKVDILLALIQQVADERPTFFLRKGAGIGNYDTNDFVADLKRRALEKFSRDFSERNICGESNHAVDFYFEDEATIIEVALTLLHPNSEYEKDIFKALLAQEVHPVKRLILIGKEGAVKTCSQPARLALKNWVFRKHGLIVDVYDIKNMHGQSL